MERKIRQLIRATPVSEGAGVVVHRSIGTPHLRHLDPFLMLDHFASSDPNDYIAGFPNHPHRGFITLTYMLDGHMLHEDSMGNRGDLRSGGVQWMKAASGVIHSEMPQQIDGLMRGFQLWINLPAREKMSAPEYQEFAATKIPTVNNDGACVRIISGTYEGAHGPIADPNTQLLYLDVTLAAGATFRHSVSADATVFLYLFEGVLAVGAHQVPTHALTVLDQGDAIALVANESGARFILVAGRPLKEPIVQHGPFVMNTPEEIRTAFADYQNDRLVRDRASRAE